MSGSARPVKYNKEEGESSVRLVVKRRKIAQKRALHTRTKTSVGRGIPSFRRRGASQAACDSLSVTSSTLDASNPDDEEEFPFAGLDHAVQHDELPCDTLLAMRSLQQGSQSLQIPLTTARGAVSTVSCVLESQLYQTLQTSHGDDSVVTRELQALVATNRVRRLVDIGTAGGRNSAAADGAVHATTIQSVVETKDYVRAVWDAHRTYLSQCGSEDVAFHNDTTTWFVSNLRNWTKRSISQDDLEEAWTKRKQNVTTTSHSCDQAIDTLVHMQVLLKTAGNRKFVVWLPNWGLVLQQLWKAERKVLQQLKRSLYKELARSHLERQNYPGLSGAFVVQHCLAQGKIEIQQRPAGAFVKLTTVL